MSSPAPPGRGGSARWRARTSPGPRPLSLSDVAAILTAAGRPTVYRQESVEEAYASRSVYGAPDWQVDAWVSTYTAIASGALDRVTHDVERLTGRRPLGFAELLAGRP